MSEGVPLPIATLLRRARNARSPKERHDLAYHAWEAALRIAVAYRPPADRARMVAPSVGDWSSWAMGDDVRLEQPDALAVLRLLSDVGQGRAAAPQSTSSNELLRALPAYRNAVIGHGGVRSNEFYENAARTLMAGLPPLSRSGALWPSRSTLAWVESVELAGNAVRRARVYALDEHGASVIDAQGLIVVDELVPRRLYLRLPDGAMRGLHPWLLFDDTELRERVLFFNGRRRSAVYLDYASGELLRGAALAAIAPDVEADLESALGAAPIVPTARERDAETDPWSEALHLAAAAVLCERPMAGRWLAPRRVAALAMAAASVAAVLGVVIGRPSTQSDAASVELAGELAPLLHAMARTSADVGEARDAYLGNTPATHEEYLKRVGDLDRYVVGFNRVLLEARAYVATDAFAHAVADLDDAELASLAGRARDLVTQTEEEPLTRGPQELDDLDDAWQRVAEDWRSKDNRFDRLAARLNETSESLDAAAFAAMRAPGSLCGR